MEEIVKQLFNQLESKDSIIKEQLKVIQDLNMQLVGIINAQGGLLAQMLSNPAKLPTPKDDELLELSGGLL